MPTIKVVYDQHRNTLTVWFGNPEDEVVAEETGDEVILMKDKDGNVIGFRSEGSAFAGILVGAITCLSVIGLGMVVASFTRTVSQAFIVANFPMAMMMFFSGVIYPLPKIVLFTLGGREIGLYDILPPTHAVVALNKIFNLGADLGQVTYELSALAILSMLYFVIGVWLFRRFHLR